MNEQFEKLMYKSGLTAQGCWDEMDSYMHDAIKQFAELIVRECAKVCDDLDIDDWGDKSFDDGTYYCSRVIKQHFGVEE